ncbi:piggyBac transposable element-derived protein 4-like [Vespula squamosa]|uniref:PiggyBac transposable element-derived protein 4-like n=1 Tax=Vespula squamosa TaxID=30214 RepID=A0ABD2C204_VESSQ
MKAHYCTKQYIPSRRNRFGIKSYMLCDYKITYVQDLIVYVGMSTITESEITGIGKSGEIVLSLLKPYLVKGHTLYVDNFYSSSVLCTFLYNNRTNACGTVKKRRKGMLKIEEQLKKGEACFRSSKSLFMMKWMDTKEVYMISNMYTADFTTVSKYGGERSVQKPVCIIDYNKLMAIVYKVHMVISTANITRKSLKWYRKFFFHLIDISVWNVYCLYKYKRGEIISMEKFQLALIKQIIAKYDHNVIGCQNRSADNAVRLTEKHFSSLATIVLLSTIVIQDLEKPIYENCAHCAHFWHVPPFGDGTSTDWTAKAKGLKKTKITMMVQTLMTTKDTKHQRHISIEILTIRDVEESIQTLSSDDNINVYDRLDKIEEMTTLCNSTDF